MSSSKHKKRVREMLDQNMRQADTAITSMINIITESQGSRKSLKLKQALLSLRVEYNRLRLKYEDQKK